MTMNSRYLFTITAGFAASCMMLFSGCGSAQRPSFRSLDEFEAYVDSLPKSGIVNLTDDAFTALVRNAARLDDDAFASCVMQPLRSGMLEDENFLLMLPDTLLQTCASGSKPYVWRLSEPQRVTLIATDEALRDRLVTTVATYRDLWRQDSTVGLRYIGFGTSSETGYRSVNAAKLSLSGGRVYSVNLIR
ncbi:MAG: hypothetical protein FGM24_11220 [Candidatus Kapabacteria bacterium]|nr:hypothetical protein [Candidatus Kapabacteria bacterium]